MNVKQYILSPRYRLRRHLLFWGLYFIFTLLTYMHDGLEKIGFPKWFALEVCEVLANMLIEIPCCCFIIYILVPVYLMKKKYVSFLFGFLILFIATSFLYYLDHLIFAHPIHEFFGLKFTNPEFFYSSFINLLIFFPVPIGITLVLKTLKSWYIEQQHFTQLQAETTDAEMQLLKAQVQPHFLFNTLNNIYAFALNDSPDAGILVEKLSHTLEYMMTECQAPLVPIENELMMIMDYMALEKVRYGDRIHIHTEITGKVASKSIAPLLLIPFAENCFKHGSSKILGDSWIKLFFEIKEKTLRFSIVNSKPKGDMTHSVKTGIGLANVRKRLGLLYPGTHSLDIKDLNDRFEVLMQIPLFNSLNR